MPAWLEPFACSPKHSHLLSQLLTYSRHLGIVSCTPQVASGHSSVLKVEGRTHPQPVPLAFPGCRPEQLWDSISGCFTLARYSHGCLWLACPCPRHFPRVSVVTTLPVACYRSGGIHGCGSACSHQSPLPRQPDPPRPLSAHPTVINSFTHPFRIC